MANYQTVLQNAFQGDPYAYRNEILRKERSGQTLTDAAAAAAFKQVNPSLFGVPVRSTVQGAGYNVDWDPTTRTIGLGETTPGGGRVDWGTLGLGDYTLIGNTAYADPTKLSTIVAGAPSLSPVPTPEAMKSYTDVVRPIYEPLYKAALESLDRRLNAIRGYGEEQKRLAETGFEEARAGLERQEGRSRLAASHAASARGVSSSPLAAYGQRKVAEAYAPEYGALERRKGTELANIASKAALMSEELAAQGKELEAQYMTNLANAAFEVYQQEVSGKSAKRKDLLGLLRDITKVQEEKESKQAEMAWEREKFYTPYKYPTANALVAYNYGPTPYQAGLLANAAARIVLEQNKQPPKGSISDRAASAVKYRITAFKRPIDFAAQIKREIAAGQLEPNIGQAMLEQLFAMYPTQDSWYKPIQTAR